MDSSQSYQSIAIVPGSDCFIGQVHGSDDSEVTLKLACVSEDSLGPYLRLKLTIVAPQHMHLKSDRYHVNACLYHENFVNFKFTKIDNSNYSSVPANILISHKFGDVMNGREGIVRLDLTVKNLKEALLEGLYNTLKFRDYLDMETGLVVQKSGPQQAIYNFRTFFERSPTLTLYVRDESSHLEENWSAMWARMKFKIAGGNVISKFYAAESPRILQFDNYLRRSERPYITTEKTFAYRDILHFVTRLGFGCIQQMEYQHAEVAEVNSIGTMKFLSIANSPGLKYLGVLNIDADIEKYIKNGDVISLKFLTNIKALKDSPKWRSIILHRLPWMKPGEVACIVHRPQVLKAGQASCKKEVYATGDVPHGNGKHTKEDDLRRELDSAPPVPVRLTLETSDSSTKRQVDSLAAIQQEFATKPKIEAWQKLWLNKNSIPQTYLNLLEKAMPFLPPLTDSDQLNIVQYLQKCPTSFGISLAIIEGRAGTGKTYFIALLIVALLQGYPEAKIGVYAPSNKPVEVIAWIVWELVKDIEPLRQRVFLHVHSVKFGNARRTVFADNSSNPDALEMQVDLGNIAVAARQLALYVKAIVSDRKRHLLCPEVVQSLEWAILLVSGVLDDLVNKDPALPKKPGSINSHTDKARYTRFRFLFFTYIEEGKRMDVEDRMVMMKELTVIRAFCVSVASVIFSTANNMGDDLYLKNFKPTITFIDEASRLLIPDGNIAVFGYKQDRVIMIGDLMQLQPVVTGPCPLSGFMPELEVSMLQYFLASYWPSSKLTIQRRSARGLMDIPTLRYHHGIAENHPDSDDPLKHPYTLVVEELIEELFVDENVVRSPAMYFELNTSAAVTDSSSKSKYNLQSAAFAVNVIEKLIEKNVPPEAIGIICPYNAQVHVLKYATLKLHDRSPSIGYNNILIGTTDSLQGEQRPVIIVDPVVTHELGFVNVKARMHVNTTRAQDAMIFLANTSNHERPRDGESETEVVGLFRMARDPLNPICRTITDRKHPFFSHPYVQPRAQRS